ncbi:hypothetical protein HYV58_00875, partial [Candidatus Peregrinibacteria bacterium]|nr:hypothetical protein [Candidatus Peregrinibacteria bacterium]
MPGENPPTEEFFQLTEEEDVLFKFAARLAEEHPGGVEYLHAALDYMLRLQRGQIGDVLNPERTLTLEASKNILGPRLGNFALKVAREISFTHERWGLVDAAAVKGIVQDKLPYSRFAGDIQIRQRSAVAVRETMENQDIITDVVPPGFSFAEFVDILFTQSNIPLQVEPYLDLALLRRIDPTAIPDLPRLEGQRIYDQEAAYQEAYRRANPHQSSRLHIFFMEASKEVTLRGNSAIQDACFSVSGDLQFPEPAEDFLRIRGALDEALKVKIGQGVFYDLDRRDYGRQLQREIKTSSFQIS